MVSGLWSMIYGLWSVVCGRKFVMHSLCFVALLLLISCNLIPQGRPPDIPKIQYGAKALEINFLQNAPPQNVLSGESFDIIAELANVGISDIKNGAWQINYESQAINVKQANGMFNLKGKQTGSLAIEKTEIITRAQALNLLPNQPSYNTIINFQTCFKYSTKGGSAVCMDTEPNSKKTKACTIQPITMPGGQGSPVSITRIETTIQKHQSEDRVLPVFKITLENTGQGLVVDENSALNQCTNRVLRKEDVNKIKTNVKLSGQQLSCETAKEQREDQREKLKTKQDTFSQKEELTLKCALPDGIEKRKGAFVSALEVEADYGYVQTKPANIRIVNVKSE